MKIKELEQKLKARDRYYSVVNDWKAQSFLIYYSFAGLPDFNSYGESRLPFFMSVGTIMANNGEFK